jgi:AraC-like DNA-binding protein/quercetin dioxygenase-like cupin family protein
MTKDLRLQEEIPHTTKERPFAIHFTETLLNFEPLLYTHWHTEAEFLYVCKGEMLLQIEETVFHIRENEMVFIPPYTIHAARNVPCSTKSCCFQAVVFSPSLLGDIISPLYQSRYIPFSTPNQLSYFVHFTRNESWMLQVMEEILPLFDLQEDKLESWYLFFLGSLLKAWQTLYNYHIQTIDKHNNQQKLHSQLTPSLDFIHKNYVADITLEEIAAASHLCKGQFCTQFKKLTSYTPFQYLTRYRILKSCDLLIMGNMKITEVATLSGFNNISYYNRMFQKIMKITPTKFTRNFYENINAKTL